MASEDDPLPPTKKHTLERAWFYMEDRYESVAYDYSYAPEWPKYEELPMPVALSVVPTTGDDKYAASFALTCQHDGHEVVITGKINPGGEDDPVITSSDDPIHFNLVDFYLRQVEDWMALSDTDEREYTLLDFNTLED